MGCWQRCSGDNEHELHVLMWKVSIITQSLWLPHSVGLLKCRWLQGMLAWHALKKRSVYLLVCNIFSHSYITDGCIHLMCEWSCLCGWRWRDFFFFFPSTWIVWKTVKANLDWLRDLTLTKKIEKNPLCGPLFRMFWLQSFCTGNHWSGHKLISLNVHQSTQRPKDLSVVQMRSSRGRSGSEMAEGREWKPAGCVVDAVSGSHLFCSVL